MHRQLSPASRSRLTEHDLDRFSRATLFDRIARALCHARCLPRKELFEAWEVARRSRRLFRGGRIVDLAAGHGLLAHVMLLLDDSSPRAVAVDRAIAPSAMKIHEELTRVWPRLAGRLEYVDATIETFALGPDDVVVSSHACGDLTDRVLERAVAAGARVAVLPCCHNLESTDADAWRSWVDGAMAIDLMRAVRLRERGYRVWTQTIPEAITPKNRLLLAAPDTAGVTMSVSGQPREAGRSKLRT
jgi:hypothetical protein